jgi:uncharacterized membrane protein YidH (DUF202 family)
MIEDADLRRDMTVGLQAERTSLAWSRTLVVISAIFGIIGVHSLVMSRPWPLTLACLAAAGALLTGSTPLARLRLERINRDIGRQLAVSATAPSLAAALLTTLASILALVTIVTQSR